jgi:hypothetical protein
VLSWLALSYIIAQVNSLFYTSAQVTRFVFTGAQVTSFVLSQCSGDQLLFLPVLK